MTLIELMVGISILVMLSIIGIPGMQSMIVSHRVAILTNDLSLSLTLARSEAVRRGEQVQVCPSADGIACGGLWRDGWLVVPVDSGSVIGAWPGRHPDLGPHLIASRASASGQAKTVFVAGNERAVIFNGIGASQNGALAFTIGVDEDPAVPGTRLLDVAASGRLALRIAPAGG